MEKLSKRALGCMYTAAIVAGLIELAFVVAMRFICFEAEDAWIGNMLLIAAVVLILIPMAASPYFRFHRYRYRIDAECIEVQEGYLFVRRNIVPLERLHKMQTLRGPIDRMFKVAKVVVTTAGGDVTLRFLEEEKAEQIAEYLEKRINQIVKEQRDENGTEC